MVYDTTSQDSFEHVEEWLSEVDRYANENTSKLLVGNKSDLLEVSLFSAQTDCSNANPQCKSIANAMSADQAPLTIILERELR